MEIVDIVLVDLSYYVVRKLDRHVCLLSPPPMKFNLEITDYAVGKTQQNDIEF